MIDKQIKTLYIWLDGVGETVFPTSLELAVTPYIDSLTSSSILGMYEFPQIQEFSHPRTDIIIPFFYGLKINEYKGRGILDLIDNNVNFNEGDHVYTIRILPIENVDNTISDSYLEDGSEIIMEIKKIISVAKIECVVNPFSSHNNQLIFWGRQKEIIETVLDQISQKVLEYQCKLVDVDKHEFHKLQNQDHRLVFCGWALGALRGAFRLLDANIIDTSTKLYDYDFYFNDFNKNVDLLNKHFEENDTFIFYIKETDKASHKSNQIEKVKAIEFCDNLLQLIHQRLPKFDKTILITDHNTNIGSPHAEYGPTPFLIYDRKKRKRNQHYCEKMILAESNIVYSITELIDMIKEG